MATMRISQLAERSGVPATTLRFYDELGLLPAARTGSGYRTYGEGALRRLAFIGAAKDLGLSLDEIAGLAERREAGPCADVKAELRPRLIAHLDEADRRAAELATLAGALRAAVEHLDWLPDRTGPCAPDCELPASPPVPVACTLAAGERDERVARWRELVDGAARHRVDGGLRLTLPIERLGTVAELAAAEQRCCPFLDIRLHLDGAWLHLEVRAPGEAGELVTELFGEQG